MATLMIKDLACSQEMSAKELGAVRGGSALGVQYAPQDNSNSNSLVNISAPTQTVTSTQVGINAASPGAFMALF